MAEPSTPPQNPEKLVIRVGAAIGFSILGDSFLYGNLPIEAQNLGIALPLVGILLSANRLVRLVSNTWASAIFEKFGPRWPFAVATALGLLTTAVYGVGWGFTAFLGARIGWGIAWSALRQGGYQAIWTGQERVRGKLMGILWGLIRLGSAFSVVFGGYLRDLWGYRAGITGVMTVTTLAIPVALSIRWPAEAERVVTSRQSFWQGWRESLTTERGRRLLAAGSVHSAFEGVLIATTSIFLARRLGAIDFLSGWGIRVGTIAGLLLALRWISDLVFGPLIGTLADRLGKRRTLLSLSLALLGSMLAVAAASGPSLIAFLSFLFICSAGLNIVLSALANDMALQGERPHIYMGVYATAVDGGAAVGPLLAFSAGAVVGFGPLYILSSLVLTGAVLRFWLSRRQ